MYVCTYLQVKFFDEKKVLTDTLNEQHRQHTEERVGTLHTYTHTYTYIHTYIHTHTYTHTYIQVSSERAALKKEFEFQLGLAQEESEKLVAGLEHAIQNMTKEKVRAAHQPHYNHTYIHTYNMYI